MRFRDSLIMLTLRENLGRAEINELDSIIVIKEDISDTIN